MQKLVWLLVANLVTFAPSVGTASILGPVGGSGLSGEYASFSDSPFSSLAFSIFQLEDFEDALLNVTGVSANTGFVSSLGFSNFRDSVDLDDGVLDGSGLAGDSYFSSNGSAGITFTFSGVLPTHAGIVWTDGLGSTTFEAFDQNSQSLGVITALIADGSISGTTADDRFFGAINTGGISAFKISNSGGGIEVDHLQFGTQANNVVPEPSSLFIWGTLSLLVGASRRRRIIDRGTSN